jgi:hypothetical protein
MNANFLTGFMKKASFKSKLLYRLSRGLDVKLKGFSKKSLKNTKAGKNL